MAGSLILCFFACELTTEDTEFHRRSIILKLHTMKKFILSLFQGYTDLRPTNTTLADLAEQIRTDEQLKAYTDKHRYYLNQRQAKAAANIKATCPCFAVSVHFDGGKRKEHIDGWTHLYLADFDHIGTGSLADCLRRVREDPHTLLAYTTISGEGLRIVELTGDEIYRNQQAMGRFT